MEQVQLREDLLYFHAFHHAAIGMTLIDTSGRFLKVNQTLTTMIGYSEEELLHMTFHDITHPDDLDIDVFKANQLGDGSIQSYRLEKRYIHKDGFHVWVRLYVSLVREDNGHSPFFVAQIKDISEQKKAEHLLKEHNQRYQSLFEHNSDIVYSLSLDGELESINSSAVRITGFEPEELVQNIPLLYEEDIKYITKQSFLSPDDCHQHYETSFPHKNGHSVKLSVTNVPIVVDGEVVGIYGIAKDITKQHMLMKQLRESEQRYRLLAENSLDLIVRCNPFGVFLYVSLASTRVLGFKPEELIGTSSRDLVHPEDLPKHLEFFAEDRTIPEECVTTFRYRRKDGSYIWIEATRKSIHSKKLGKVIEHVSVFRDVTERREKKEALRRSESHLALAQEIANIGSWEWDLRNHRFNCSDTLYKIVGVEPGTLHSIEDFLAYVHPEDRRSKEDILETVLAQGKIERELRIVRPDGTIRYIHTVKKLFLDESGKAVRLIGTDQDITERKAEQQRLREAEELYQLISQNSQDIITYTTPDGVFKYVSPAIRRLLGYEPEEVIGKNSWELYHPEDTLILQQRSYDDEDVYWNRVRHKNGSYVWIETTVKFIRNEQHEIVKILGVARDITERKQQEETYKRIVEQSPDAILIGVDRFKYVNDTAVQLFGALSKEELLQIEPISLVHPNYRHIALERKDTVRQRKVAELTELKYIRLDGQVIDAEVKSIPTFFNGEEAVHTIVRDITERKKTQQLLQQSEKLTLAGQFAAGIAHEIRNPLTSIKGFLQLLRTEATFKEHYFTIMLDELNRIETILSELLLLAKPKNSNYQVKNVVEILSSVVALLDTQAILNDIQILQHIKVERALVYCDENQLKQVFINLIKNAIEAMTSGGNITIIVDRENEELVLQFIDQGPGIPKETLSRIGQPFFTTKETGTGLGLSVSYSIIEAHQGTICLSSEENIGTSFTITLPSYKN